MWQCVGGMKPRTPSHQHTGVVCLCVCVGSGEDGNGCAGIIGTLANEFSCTYNFHFAGHDARLERWSIGGYLAAVLAAYFRRHVLQSDLRGIRNVLLYISSSANMLNWWSLVTFKKYMFVCAV